MMLGRRLRAIARDWAEENRRLEADNERLRSAIQRHIDWWESNAPGDVDETFDELRAALSEISTQKEPDNG